MAHPGMVAWRKDTSVCLTLAHATNIVRASLCQAQDAEVDGAEYTLAVTLPSFHVGETVKK